MEILPGLKLYENYLSVDDELNLITKIKQGNWMNELRRRVQHYGYQYNYQTRDLSSALIDAPLPDWTDGLTNKMIQDGLIPKPMEQMIVNEYQIGQGITRHIDAKVFDNIIISVSLNSPCVMIFTERTSKKIIEVILPPRSLLLMKDDARNKWFHEIPARKIDGDVPRELRYSLTFRYLAPKQIPFSYKAL